MGDLKVLVKEELLAKEKLEALKGLLDTTTEIGLMVSMCIYAYMFMYMHIHIYVFVHMNISIYIFIREIRGS
jgi:hypothetical protein